MTLGMGPGPLGALGPYGGGLAHQSRSWGGAPLSDAFLMTLGLGLGPFGGAQHTKVEVRVAHLLGMHSLDDFRVSGLEVRTALILGAHQSRN